MQHEQRFIGTRLFEFCCIEKMYMYMKKYFLFVQLDTRAKLNFTTGLVVAIKQP
jgi:hypothetical protein